MKYNRFNVIIALVNKGGSEVDSPKLLRPYKIRGGEKMANIKSAQKRIKITEVKTKRNTMIKSALKTTIKKFELSLVGGNVAEAGVAYASVVRSLDMAASKGIIHRNMAGRKKSRLASKLKALTA